VLLCQGCFDDHASVGHMVSSVGIVGKEQACDDKLAFKLEEG
jgi:hypothetical protein